MRTVVVIAQMKLRVWVSTSRGADVGYLEDRRGTWTYNTARKTSEGRERAMAASARLSTRRAVIAYNTYTSAEKGGARAEERNVQGRSRGRPSGAP